MTNELDTVDHGEVLSGVCKDCGNGTLNNLTNPAFEFVSYDSEEGEHVVCNKCGSQHLDLV